MVIRMQRNYNTEIDINSSGLYGNSILIGFSNKVRSTVEVEKMTEKEKMEKQMLYDANYDRELELERLECKTLCQEYNNLPIKDLNGRKSFVKRILGKTGESVHIEPNFWCDYGRRIEVGENFYANHGLVIVDAGKVTFGDNGVIGSGSIVVKDIPANSVAVGNPCRVIREITDEDRNKCWDK